MHDSWTMVKGLPEGVEVLGGGGQREENWDNSNSIKKKIFF